MLFLDSSQLKFKKAFKQYFEGMFDFILNKIEKLNKIETPNFDNKFALKFIENMLIYDIENILKGNPQQLIELHEKYESYLGNKDIVKGINYVFNYDLFIEKAKTRYDAYELASSLSIDCCPYCNRNYTITVVTKKGKKITRPQFDHFFDKARHPLLAVSFFNLIPSCSTCNSSIKGSKLLNLTDYTHPYIDDYISDVKFTYKFDNESKNGIKAIIKTPLNSKIRNTVQLFSLEEIYNSHTNDIKDLIKIRNSFSDKYLEILSKNLLRDVIVSKEELYRLAFGTEILQSKFIGKPFSKFKHDYLKELGIII